MLHNKNYINMEITDAYINSTRLVNSVSMAHVRYLYDIIDWSSRMVCIKGARGVGKTTLMLQRMKQLFPKKNLIRFSRSDRNDGFRILTEKKNHISM